MMKLLTFKLDGETYGVDIDTVQEVIGFIPLTAVPRTDMHVKGIIRLRGVVVPVVDLRQRLGRDPIEPTRDSAIIIMDLSWRKGSRFFGAVVDGVEEVVDMPAETLLPPPRTGQSESGFIHAMGRHGEKFVMILDTRSVFTFGSGEESQAAESSSARPPAPFLAEAEREEKTPPPVKRPVRSESTPKKPDSGLVADGSAEMDNIPLVPAGGENDTGNGAGGVLREDRPEDQEEVQVSSGWDTPLAGWDAPPAGGDAPVNHAVSRVPDVEDEVQVSSGWDTPLAGGDAPVEQTPQVPQVEDGSGWNVPVEQVTPQMLNVENGAESAGGSACFVAENVSENVAGGSCLDLTIDPSKVLFLSGSRTFSLPRKSPPVEMSVSGASSLEMTEGEEQLRDFSVDHESDFASEIPQDPAEAEELVVISRDLGFSSSGGDLLFRNGAKLMHAHDGLIDFGFDEDPPPDSPPDPISASKEVGPV
ncbi:MAG: chemotaxis protein CheW [Magnetococcales bacterium]|nr:chemotaxis protein CheW [Magnetococcales bacterium]